MSIRPATVVLLVPLRWPVSTASSHFQGTLSFWRGSRNCRSESIPTNQMERPMFEKFFADPSFDFETRSLVGDIHYGAGDIGEMLTAVAAVVDGEAQSWVDE